MSFSGAAAASVLADDAPGNVVALGMTGVGSGTGAATGSTTPASTPAMVILMAAVGVKLARSCRTKGSTPTITNTKPMAPTSRRLARFFKLNS